MSKHHRTRYTSDNNQRMGGPRSKIKIKRSIVRYAMPETQYHFHAVIDCPIKIEKRLASIKMLNRTKSQ